MHSISSLAKGLLALLLSLTALSGVSKGDVILTTGFEGSTSLPAGWTQSLISGEAGAAWSIGSGGAGSNPPSAYAGSNNARLFYGSTSDTKVRLISPSFNTTGLINLSLSFWHTQWAWYGIYQDDLRVLYSSNGGSTWTELAHYTNDITEWTRRDLDIPVSGSNIRIAFEGNAKWGHGICLDDILVTGIPDTWSEVSVSATDPAASEVGSDPGTWTITRTGNTTGALSVNYMLSGNATAGSDYHVDASNPINFAAGETSKVITLTPVDDTVEAEGEEVATLTLTSGTAYAIDAATDSITIHDDEGYGLNILVIGSTHSFSEDGESGAVQEAAFNPTTIATNLKSLLLADPANTDSVNVVFEDIYRTSLQPVIGGGNSNTVYTEANATWMTFECHTLAQYFMWPDGKDARMANLRGQAGTQWDYIVIVEDPYVLANFPGMYAEAAKLFHEEISKGTGELVLMSQWPKAGSTFTANAFNEHSFRVGKSLDLKVSPAAKAWNDLTTKDTSANHPTPNGAYLAAASLYSTLTTRNANGFVTGSTNKSLTQLAYDTVQSANSAAQFSGVYSEPNKFQMKYNRKRLFIGSQQGTSTENGIWYNGILRAAHSAGVCFTIPNSVSINVYPVDFNLGRGYLGVEKYYIVDPAKYSRSYGFPTGDNSQPRGAEVMRYGIDKRNNGGTYDENTDLGIAYNMLRQGEVEPAYDVRAIPMRLLWSKLYHYDPTIAAHDDLWHLSTQINRAAGSYLFTLDTGRCAIGDEPSPQGSKAWQQWLGQKIGYETAWQMSHMTSRVPGFRVVPTTDKPETGYVVTPDFSQGLSVKFVYPPKSNVTVSVSVDDPAAGAVDTASLTFTPQNYNIPQIVTVTGVNRENGEFPFKVVLTTSSNDVVYHGHRDEWDFKNNVVGTTGSVLIGGWEGPKPFTPDQVIVNDNIPSRASDTPLQSPTLEGKVAATLAVDNGTSLGASGAMNHPLSQRYLWGSADLDVKPNDITSTIVYRSGAPYVLTLTVTNNHPTKDLRLDAIHWITARATSAPTQVTITYANGDLTDSPGANTVVTLTTGAQHNANLSTFLSDRVLFRGQSATFTWTPDPTQFTGSNPTLSVDNFAISGNLIPSTSPNRAPVANAGVDQTVYLGAPVLWTPASINTVAWYDAADSGSLWADTAGTTPATAKVARWDDKSGNGRHALQATGTRQPTYKASDPLANNMPSVGDQASSGSIGLDTPSFAAKNVYVVVYYKDGLDTTFDTYATLLSGPGGNGQYRIMGSQNSANFIGSGHFNDAGTYKNGSTSNTLNGALAMPVSIFKFKASASRTQVHGLGYNKLDNTRNWQGSFCEWIFTDGTETAETEAMIEGYLAHKWGLAGKLPTGHAYENRPPGIRVAMAGLQGTAVDADGDNLTTSWTMDSATGPAVIANSSALDANVTFNQTGTYVFRLDVTDPWQAASNDTVKIQVVESVNYEIWKASTFSKTFTNNSLTANQDGDQLTNLQEYAFGLDPTNPVTQPLSYASGGSVIQTGIPVLVHDGSGYSAVFPRRKDYSAVGLTYIVEFSSDLVLWTASGAAPSRLTSVSSVGEYEAVSVPYPATVPVDGGGAQQAPKFFRVGVRIN